MAKLTNVRERVHQPFRDTLIRTAGYSTGAIQDQTNLFAAQGRTQGESNMPGGGGSTLPSDQSMVVLALRVFLWFRNSIQRGGTVTPAGTGTAYPSKNGDFQYNAQDSKWDATQSNLTNGNQNGSPTDVHRLYWQSSEQLFWTFGTGQKPSLSSMPSAYMPYGGGLHGQLGGITELIHWDNGLPDHTGILRLARAILLPPRQNVSCIANLVALPDGGNNAAFNGTQGSRNMLSLRDNLNAVDLVNKVISFTFDGLFSRDVQ